MSTKLVKRGGAGLVAVAAAIALAIVPSISASAAIVPTVGSAHDLYLLSDEDGTQIPAGTAKGWNDSALASPEASDEDFNSKFAVPAGTTSVRTFIAPRGQENNLSAWNAYGPLGLTPTGILLANLKPSANTSAGLGTPSGSGAVGIAGGDYSLGIAFLNNGGLTIVETDYTYITVAGNANPNLATWTFATPVDLTAAPVVTTQPASTSAAIGANATFTAAASGTPTPTVKWQSAPVATSTFTDIAAGPGYSGITTNTLTVNNVQSASAGLQFRAVYTNSKGSTNSNTAVLTVTLPVPTEPTGTDPNKITPASPITVPDGSHSFALTATGIAAGTYGVYGWSTPTVLPNATVDASGNVTIDVTGLLPGVHTIAIVSLVDGHIVGWLTITVAGPLYPTTANVDLSVDVLTSNKFALEGVASALNLGSAPRGGSTSADLPPFTVTDDRDSLPGWNLNSTVSNFVNDGVAVPANAGDVIDKSALVILPRKVGGTVTGILEKPQFTAGTGVLFAEGLLNSSTASTGTQFDAKLTFTVPATAKKGTYKSTLTLTLVSKP